jgi:hypothetical protein
LNQEMAASGASAWDWAQLAILFLGYSSEKIIFTIVLINISPKYPC